MTTDLTDRYYTDRYMPRGRAEGTLDREAEPFTHIMIHHVAGYYGSPLGVEATREQEIEQIDRMAADHAGRDEPGDRWVGPGYNECIFQSGRRYAVGKAGTVRRHFGQGSLNRRAYAIVVFGNYQSDQPSEAMLAAIEDAVAEVRTWTHIVSPTVLVLGHRDGWNQTDCPGKNVYRHMARFKAARFKAQEEEHDMDQKDVEALVEAQVAPIKEQLDSLNAALVQERFPLLRFALQADMDPVRKAVIMLEEQGYIDD